MKKLCLIVMIFIGVVAIAMPSQATTITFDYNFEFSGASMPSAEAPWLRAIFDDEDTPGTVKLTISAINLDDLDDYVGKWYFNVAPTLEGSLDSFNIVQDQSGSHSSDPVAAIYKEANAYKADGDGYYDIKFSFPTSNSENRFENGDVALFNITYTGITASSFHFLSYPSGGNGPFYSAAHIQSLGSEDDDSGWVAPVSVPEATTIILLGLGLIAVAGFRRR